MEGEKLEGEVIKIEGEKYRSFLVLDHDDEAADMTTRWRHGAPPTYDAVNHLFEQGRTKVIRFCLASYCN